MILTLLLCLGLTAGLAGLGGVCWWAARRQSRGRIRPLFAVLSVIGFAGCLPTAALAGYLVFRLAAGQPESIERPLGSGVIYRRLVMTVPRRVVVHRVDIADATGMRLAVTPPTLAGDGLRNPAGLATEAIRSLQADLLVNANFFTPFKDNSFLDYRPHAGEPVEPVGPVIADGQRYGRPKPGWPSVWQRENGEIGFGDLPAGAMNAVTGRQWLVRGGKPGVVTDEPPYPRTAIATDADRKRLWLIVVDGKQPRYSKGLTLNELADLIAGLGASDAIELDGGGSSILVDNNDSGGPTVLSRPCHTKIPGRQRPTGVFLGIRLAK
jgi:hypothetical protein